jgi:phage-related protein
MVARANGKSVALFSLPVTLMKWALALARRRELSDRLLGSFQLDIEGTCRTMHWRPPYSVREGVEATVRARGTSV